MCLSYRNFYVKDRPIGVAKKRGGARNCCCWICKRQKPYEGTCLLLCYVIMPLILQKSITGCSLVVSMKKIGASGYWSLPLKLGEGEYQYSYLVEGGQQVTDPTVRKRVKDYFRGENSVITIKL
jgi:hypothetical protein